MKPLNRRSFLRLGFTTGTAALLASYSLFFERFSFQINTYDIAVPNLPKIFTNFRITHLTDLHHGLFMPLTIIRYLIDKANSLGSDIIVCTGDYVNEKNGIGEIDSIWPELMRLEAKYGVYSVLGNHDHWADTDRSLYWLNRSGQNIRHRSVPIKKDDRCFWIGGAGDYLEDEFGADKAFRHAPAGDCKILLAHNPDSADIRSEVRVDLMISGHTHGGQVRIPFYGAPMVPVNNKIYTSGFIKAGAVNLFISRGLGTVLFPVRFNCYPEISVLKLRRDDQRDSGYYAKR